MSKAWFTSDWHLFSTSFLKNPLRVGFSSVEDMNTTILSNIFEQVKPGDNLYFLGDIGQKFPENYLSTLFNNFKKHRINFHWIEGNHDKDIHINNSSIKWRGQIKDIVVNKQAITLSHYPLIVWNKSHYDAWNLFGHIHYQDNTWNTLSKISKDECILLKSKRCNVNIELYNFKPLEFEEIKLFFNVEYFEGSKIYKNFDLIERK